ncbi:MAG: serine protease [Thermaerobacterales bacterium]
MDDARKRGTNTCPENESDPGGRAGEETRNWDDLPEDDQPNRPQTGCRLWLRRLVALFVMLAVFGLFFGNLVQVLQWPALDFLQQSRRLAGDPEIRRWRAAVVGVRVASPIPGAPSSFGTGFNIHPDGIVITNRHVIRGATEVTVVFEDAGSYRAVDIAVHPTVDLAVLSLMGEDLPVIGLETEELPAVSDRVTIIGNPFGLPRVIIQGTVEGYRLGSDQRPRAMVIDAPIHQGNSGSPVIDRNGRVVAVVYAVTSTALEAADHRGLALPARYLEDLLEP